MLGTYSLFSRKVTAGYLFHLQLRSYGLFSEALRCKTGALVKGFISTPRTVYNMARFHSFSSKGTHYSGHETIATT